MQTRPGEFETEAVRLLMSVSDKLGREGVPHRVHVAHVAHAPILAEIQRYVSLATCLAARHTSSRLDNAGDRETASTLDPKMKK